MQRATEIRAHYTLRIAVAMCFIGHGAFGIITKPIWANYFAVFGVSRETSFQLMPVVGVIDVILGIIMLVYPMRAIPAWLIIWGAFTALLRPMAGEPFAEFIERGGNFGAPLALLVLAGGSNSVRGWFQPIRPKAETDPATFARFATCLRIVAFLLILGHGWLNLIEKKTLLNQYQSVGFSHPEQVAQIVGLAEIIAAFLILVKPFRSFVFLVLIWKMGSEAFYPKYELFEWVERGGSYGVLLALWMVTERKTLFAWPTIRLATK